MTPLADAIFELVLTRPALKGIFKQHYLSKFECALCG
jgi:hypothetical protein